MLLSWRCCKAAQTLLKLTVFSKLMKRKQVVVCVPDRFVSKVTGSLNPLWRLRFCLDRLRNIAMLSHVTGDGYSCTHFIIVVVQCSLVLAKLVCNRTQSLLFKILVLGFWALHGRSSLCPRTYTLMFSEDPEVMWSELVVHEAATWRRQSSSISDLHTSLSETELQPHRPS